MRPRQTRGKTKPGRLAALNRAILRLDPPHNPSAALAWDLGFGAHTHTSLDWCTSLREAGWDASVLGLETHEGRARFAQRSNTKHCRFALAQDPLSPPWNRAPRWIRAMNVLRQYRAHECEAWHRRWSSQLAPGGHLFEGTCCPNGSVLVAHWMTPSQTLHVRRGLIFFTDFSQGFAPLLFGDRLPKDLRAHARQPGAIGDFLSDWTQAWQGSKALNGPASFLHSAQAMSRPSDEVRAWSDEHGATLLWTPANGVPRQSPPA